MPHVNDARRRAECARMLGAPPYIEAAARSGSSRPLDSDSPGQQEFQALLLHCLLSPYRSLDWDCSNGRAFQDMRLYYSWVSPQPGRLVTGWTVAARVASYLLPSAGDRGPGFSGIPGLRLARVTASAIELVHLPTGGRLDLHDRPGRTRASRAAELEDEIGASAGREPEDGQPLWTAPALAPAEHRALAAWTLTRHAPALSAVMARISVLWDGNTGAELRPDAATGIPQLSWWEGPSPRYVSWLLADPASPLYLPGSRRWPQSSHSVFVGVGDAAVGLRGPSPAGDRPRLAPPGSASPGSML